MTDTATESSTSTELRAPSLWNVKILNDDFTPIDFVIDILISVFKQSEAEAVELTVRVHEQGSAIVGTYTKDIAITKCRRAMLLAEKEEHPLQLIPEASA